MISYRTRMLRKEPCVEQNSSEDGEIFSFDGELGTNASIRRERLNVFEFDRSLKTSLSTWKARDAQRWRTFDTTYR
jgi:hypothetical protein